jgi:Cytochrome c7 and related cytochrome c
MGQIFHSSANAVARAMTFGAVAAALGVGWLVLTLNRSVFVTEVSIAKEQPVPFSHKHHVLDVGLDCRYCHTAVENSSAAGMPPTKTCNNCHSVLFADQPMFTPVQESLRTDRSLAWVRVHDLPDYVYFNHSIHVQKGIGCTTCHGEVQHMPLTWKVAPLQMEWCLNCHRQPEQFIRPRAEVFNVNWKPGPDHAAEGRRLVEDYGVNVKQLENCSVCHR